MQRTILAAVLASATVSLLPAVAGADCALSTNIVFSYPSAETTEVPLDAVFWAVPQDGFGDVIFRLDGVELQPVERSDEGRFQFAPSEPLSPGVHDVEILPREAFPEGFVEAQTLRLRVEAVEQAAVEAEATIEAVTHFPLPRSDGNVIYPDQDSIGEGCAPLASLHGCQDIIPETLVRMDFSASGNALGYLLEGAILPPSCRAYFPYEYAIGDAAPYQIKTILPTGLSAPRVFQGESQVVPTAVPTPVDRPRMDPPVGNRSVTTPTESCAVHPTAAGASSAELCLLAAAVVFVSRRRRR
jgi:hypothetical protein